MLSLSPRFLVVGEAEDGVQAVAMAAELSPDVIIMDIQMPNMDGLEATKRISATANAPKIIGLSASDQAIAYAMLKAGAVAFIAKERAFADLIAAIESLFPAARLGETCD